MTSRPGPHADAFAGVPPSYGGSLTQAVRSLSSPFWARADVTDASPLTCDLSIAPKFGEHWVLDNAIFQGKIATSTPPAGQILSPVSGLFLVEKDRTTSVESLAQAQVGDGFDIRARGISLPISFSVVPLANGGWGFAMFYVGQTGRTVPEGWTLRGILNCNPGTATPGPGAGSFGELIGVIARELNFGSTQGL